MWIERHAELRPTCCRATLRSNDMRRRIPACPGPGILAPGSRAASDRLPSTSLRPRSCFPGLCACSRTLWEGPRHWHRRLISGAVPPHRTRYWSQFLHASCRCGLLSVKSWRTCGAGLPIERSASDRACSGRGCIGFRAGACRAGFLLRHSHHPARVLVIVGILGLAETCPRPAGVTWKVSKPTWKAPACCGWSRRCERMPDGLWLV